MSKRYLPVFTLFLVISVSFAGCSFLARLNRPLTDREQLTADVWPILNSTQKKELNSLGTLGEIEEFLDKFWEALDPTPGTEFNEYREVYEQRLEYVKIHYRYRRGWSHSDRGRVYLKFGPPDDVYAMPFIITEYVKGPEMEAAEIWVYNIYINNKHFPNLFDQIDSGLLKFVFADYSGVGQYTQVYSNLPGEKVDPTVFRSTATNEFMYIGGF